MRKVSVGKYPVFLGIFGYVSSYCFVARTFFTAVHQLVADAVLQVGTHFPPLLAGVVHPPTHGDGKRSSDLEFVSARQRDDVTMPTKSRSVTVPKLRSVQLRIPRLDPLNLVGDDLHQFNSVGDGKRIQVGQAHRRPLKLTRSRVQEESGFDEIGRPVVGQSVQVQTGIG